MTPGSFSNLRDHQPHLFISPIYNAQSPNLVQSITSWFELAAEAVLEDDTGVDEANLATARMTMINHTSRRVADLDTDVGIFGNL